MRVSVLIPTFERRKDLAELLESLLQQTVMPVEVIVIDDSPTATIRTLCREYKDQFQKVGVPLRYMKNPRERSTTIARNLGATRAKGDILLFLDSDVILYPDYLETLIETFQAHPDAMGVQGWTVFPPLDLMQCKGFGYHAGEVLKTLFRLHHHGRDTCRYPEYPIVLTRTISCDWMSGANLAVKRKVFDEFTFDETLKQYAYMEDVLFSRLISQKYPNTLFMTPNAKCIHKVGGEGRTAYSRLRNVKRQNRKYVFTRLFGWRGFLLYGWQLLGLTIFTVMKRIRRWRTAVDEPASMPPLEYAKLLQRMGRQRTRASRPNRTLN